MTSEKRDTAKKKVADFDFGHLFDGTFQKYATVPVTVTSEDGTERELLAPIEGDEVTEGTKRGALEYARTLRRIDDAWKVEPTPEEAGRLGDHLASFAGAFVIENLRRVAEERFDADELDAALGNLDDDALDVALKHYQRVIRDALDAEGLAQIVGQLERGIAATVLQDFEADHGIDALKAMSEEEYDQLFEKAYAELQGDYRVSYTATYAQEYARAALEELKPSEATLGQLVAMFRIGPSASGLVTLGTDPIQTEMRKHLLRHAFQSTDDKLAWTADRKDHIRIRTSTDFEGIKEAVKDGKRYDFSKASTEYAFEEQEDVLENIQRTLLGIKKHGAALLKLHLDLTNAAYDVGGERPFIFYNFADALERLGYQKSQTKRAFDTSSVQRLRDRLFTLRRQMVAAYHTKHAGKEYLTSTPYWIARRFHDPRQEPSPFVDDLATLTRSTSATAYTAVTIEPGDWWESTNMSSFRVQVPGEVLRLPTHGKNNEPERMALKIASHLAIEIRRNQGNHAGKSIRRKVGTLLEESEIVTWEAFSGQHPTQANRRREYLNDLNNEGALAILRRLKAYDVTVYDEADFFASGHGWREKFWEARLEIQIPDLGIRKQLTS